MASIFKFSICLFLLTATTAFAQTGKTTGCSVRGRVIDDDGNPVAGAIVLVDAGTPKGWEDLIVIDRSHSDGQFSYPLERCPFPKERRTLYLTSRINYDNAVPFSAPFWRNQKAGLKFAGQTIKKQNRSDIDLGDVSVQVFFTTVLVHFQDERGRPLMPPEKWEDFRFKLKTENGVVVSERNISHAVRATDSSLVMELPEGKWLIEVVDPSGKNDWLKPDTVINVPRKASPMEVTLRMSKKN